MTQIRAQARVLEHRTARALTAQERCFLVYSAEAVPTISTRPHAQPNRRCCVGALIQPGASPFPRFAYAVRVVTDSLVIVLRRCLRGVAFLRPSGTILFACRLQQPGSTHGTLPSQPSNRQPDANNVADNERLGH
ncbi:hypothetical protein NMY22_g6182 [Coprinellus aureogranulatus]|nr:hypothetical protein NMY22_g6182 [Coprinellus aureogranulatus]